MKCFYLEFDLDEQKFKKMAQKQHEIQQSVQESIQDVQTFNTPQPQETVLDTLSQPSVVTTPKMTTTEKKSIPAPGLKQASVEISPSFEDEADNKQRMKSLMKLMLIQKGFLLILLKI